MSHSCALLSDDTVKCWGDNMNGQLGNGTTTSSTPPVEGLGFRAVEVSGITTATSIALGYSHSCALLSDGTVKCWGDNMYGQLGNGTTTSSTPPVEGLGFRAVEVSGITTATSIAMGYSHSCALMSDGKVKC
jgi:alpha-tubulin suppressor-like RCC1 family protein